LIQRGAGFFRDKIQFAADAGASFAIIYNNRDGDDLLIMGGTDFVPIPAVLIGQSDGEALVSLLQTNTAVAAQLQLEAIKYQFTITNTWLCEHVGVTVTTDHSRRGDLRITLVSPAGTRSVLQTLNDDGSAGPDGWTYYSTHHFYESSAGSWTVYFGDEARENTGSVQNLGLTIYGVPLTDKDRDGLDDEWELAHFGKLTFGPKDDPDGDGYSNMREQLLGTDPQAGDEPFELDLSLWNTNYARLSWPSGTNRSYEVLAGFNAIAPSTVLVKLPGQFPQTEWFVPYANLTQRFIRVRALPTTHPTGEDLSTTTAGNRTGGHPKTAVSMPALLPVNPQ
jgi:subtilisin-like proprotein convertase family protein